MAADLAPHHLAKGVCALSEIRLAVLGLVGACVANFQKALGCAVHVLGGLPWQRLHCIAELDHLRGRAGRRPER